ncbi:MAG: DUF4153 domain-containing protein [Clostridia bacterium]|nr:DUF4153 domain-containing protein [Clostridia bacterium]
MLTRIKNGLNDMFLRLMASLKRFPEPIALAFAIVVILIFINHNHPREDTLARVALVLALGIPLTLCVKMFFERKKVSKVTEILVLALAAAGLAAYYRFLLPDMNMVSMSRYIGLSLPLYLLFMAIPYIGQKEDFEIYVIKLFTGFIVTYFYSLILFLGLVAINFTIDTLFSAGIPERVYLDLFFIVAGIFAPTYFLSVVPEQGVRFRKEDYPKFLKVLLLYIVLPLLTVYTAILYAYFIKIIVTRFWPAGIVSHLVLWYSFISIIAIFFIYILREDSTWARTFITYFPKLILPLLAMMFIAMGIRIDAYGITENRYWVMAGGLWATGCMLYLAFRKKPSNIKIVLSLAIIAALTVTGPWSAYSVSKYSQNARFEKLLTENNMLVDGRIVPSQTVSQKDKISISSIIQYFERNHSLSQLKILPPDFSINKMKEVFGFELTYTSMSQYFNHFIKEESTLLDIRGYDYYLSSQFIYGKGEAITQEDLSVSYNRDTFVLTIKKAGRTVYERNVGDIALAIHEKHYGVDSLERGDMTFVDENVQFKLVFLFNHISGHKEGSDGQPRIEWMDFSLLVKVK